MRVRSINVGDIRRVSIKGREVDTSIFKHAVGGPVEVTAEGLRGDHRVSPRACGAADHAVYLYAHEHYAHWAAVLGCEGFPDGQFGENLTTEGLLETDVRVGDVLRCGTVVLQVVQPRLPCAKLNARMGQRFAGTFLRSGRLGFFARVLTPGAIRAGDTLEVEDSDPGSPTMAEFIRISQHDYWDADGLAGLLAARGLPDWWREVIEDKLARARNADGWLGLRELEVRARDVHGDDTVSLWLACPHGKALAPFVAGQYLTLALRVGDDHAVVRRSFVITSAPDRTDGYRITVRRARAAGGDRADGVVSSALITDVGVGDRVRATAPVGEFTLAGVAADCPGLLLVSQGIAAASVVGSARAWLARAGHAPVRWLHQSTAGGDPFADQVAGLRAAGVVYREHGDIGSAELDGAVPVGGHAMIAGASPFVARVAELLADRGVTVATESYGRGPV